jgi:hypothetical protein
VLATTVFPAWAKSRLDVGIHHEEEIIAETAGARFHSLYLSYYLPSPSLYEVSAW